MAGLLALVVFPAPSAVAGQGPGDDGLDPALLRELTSTIDRDAASGGRSRGEVADRPRRVDVVTDPRGDARRPLQPQPVARGPRPFTRLADLTRARYRVPSTDGGDVRITTRWTDLVDGSRTGVRRQTQITYLVARGKDEAWSVRVGNGSDRVDVLRYDDGLGTVTRVRPEEVVVERTFGAGGTIDVVLSAEWLDARRVGLGTVSAAGDGRAEDSTRFSRVLVAGPVDG